jgi:hypothetical protein
MLTGLLSSASVASIIGKTSPDPSSAVAHAEDEADLTTKMFNPDGSLKEGIESEAKCRSVELQWGSDSSTVTKAVDGNDVGGTSEGSSVSLSYKLPEKWDSKDLYLDRSEGVNAKACNRITVYRAPGSASIDRLEKASRIGIGKALDVTDDLKEIRTADLIGGRSVTKDDGQRYYEFDMAVAPETCDTKDADNLNLGFCPYNSIYLLSATILDDRLYVFCVQCDKSQWKRANSDLRRVRSSFQVAGKYDTLPKGVGTERD